MSYGVAPTPQQLLLLRNHSAKQLAGAAGVNERTAIRALAGEPVYRFCLEALISAAKQLSSAGAGQTS